MKGNLYASEFFYELERDGAKDFFSKEEITLAIKKAINTSIENDQKYLDFAKKQKRRSDT